MALDNYGDVKESVRATLGNRKDLDGMIPTFVALAERRIYRTLRVPSNEAVYKVETSANSIQIPRDYLECKLLLAHYNNRKYALQRLPDIQFLQRMHDSPGEGRPTHFGRLVKELYWHPPQDIEPFTIELVYWQDLSGQLVNDADTNDVLRIAPGLYLYGALMEAELYIGHDDRVPTWNAKFAQSLMQINEHAHMAEHSGSELATEYPY